MEWKKTGILINREYLIDLGFVDHIVLMSESTYELQQVIFQVHRESQKAGLIMNMQYKVFVEEVDCIYWTVNVQVDRMLKCKSAGRLHVKDN